MHSPQLLVFKDRWLLKTDELELIHEVVDSCPRLSRQELANTVCELLGWRRANGGLKTWECKQLLEHLEQARGLGLPPLRETKPRGVSRRLPRLGCRRSGGSVTRPSPGGGSGAAVLGRAAPGATVVAGAGRSATTIWVTRWRSGRACSTWCRCSDPGRKWWPVCSFPLRPGGWPLATTGLAGRKPPAEATFRRSSTRADF